MTTRIPLLLASLALLLVGASGAASAHASKAVGDAGDITIVWGWTNEPAVTMTKNGLDLAIRNTTTREGIGGLEGTNLTVEIHKGEAEYHVESLATVFGKGPGNYTASEPITPTAEGIYVLHVSGTILGQEIDVEIPHNHEVHAIEATYFPELAAPGDDLEARIAALETQVAALQAEAQTQAATPATVSPQPTPASSVPAPAVALVGLAAVAVALALRRRA